jgi:hypothetical protein
MTPQERHDRLRKRKARRREERRRRALGAKPQSESLSRIQPWAKLGMSRARWYRLGKPDETTSCAAGETTSCELTEQEFIDEINAAIAEIERDA